ncbi:MAG: hypothetical protein H6581_14940 [Bacteroidia bacterium]|nr:hypothetical protein [Bacteroidia bacterium]
MKIKTIYLIICLIIFASFSFGSMRGYRFFSALSSDTWTHSTTAPVHK